MLYKLTEFQGGSGRYYVTCEDLLGKPGPHWHIPAIILGISIEEFIKELKDKYHADIISYTPETRFLLYSWGDISKERKFKNYINAQARKINFQI